MLLHRTLLVDLSTQMWRTISGDGSDSTVSGVGANHACREKYVIFVLINQEDNICGDFQLFKHVRN
jgi:hypothetical protein